LRKVDHNTNEWSYVVEVEVGGNRAYPLGPTETSFPVQASYEVKETTGQTSAGDCVHWVGIQQQTRAAATLRVYFDFPEDKLTDWDLGYIQFVQLKSCGEVIPPAYLPALASRDLYSWDADRITSGTTETHGELEEKKGSNPSNEMEDKNTSGNNVNNNGGTNPKKRGREDSDTTTKQGQDTTSDQADSNTMEDQSTEHSIAQLDQISQSLSPQTHTGQQDQTQLKSLFVEFMAPGNARTNFKSQSRQVPFYALNAAARGDGGYLDLAKAGSPCGSIRASKAQRRGNQNWARNAYLRVSVSPFLPSRKLLGDYCDNAEAIIKPSENTVLTAEQVMNQTFYASVMQILKDEDFDVADENVRDAQAVGDFLLIMLDEKFDDSVVIARAPAKVGDGIGIWLVDEETYPSLEQQAVREAVASIRQWLAWDRGKIILNARKPRGGRGTGGVLSQFHPLANSDQPLLEMDLYSVVYATRQEDEKQQQKKTRREDEKQQTRIFRYSEIQPVSAVLTKLRWIYNPITEQLELQPPQEPTKFDVLGQFDAPLKTYTKLLDDERKDAYVDVSGFLLAGISADLAPAPS